MDDDAFYQPVGNGTDIAMIRFLQDAEVPVQEQIQKKHGNIEAVIPLSPIRKRQVTAVKHPEMEGVIRVYVKGAPEYLLHKCTRTFKENGSRD